MASIKTNKIKNKQHFLNPIFHVIQLCFWSGRDSSPLKVFKMYFIFGWVAKQNIAYQIRIVLITHSNKYKVHFKDLYGWGNPTRPKAKFYIMKNWNKKVLFVFLILFVLIDAILLSLTLQKRTLYNFFFLLFPHLSNIFAPHINNLEMYFAVLICFEF